jgi:putative ABC transport system permease protein
VSTAVADPPIVLGSGHGGLPARRAVTRWAWRLFRREWRQQTLVVALLLVAVAATVAGLGLATNLAVPEAARFGTADRLATLTGTGAQLDAEIAALRQAVGEVEVIAHQKIPVPGSATAVDLRAQDPSGPFGHPTLRLTAGRWPQGADEIAVTDRVATIFGLRVGGTWAQDGRRRQVVGLVENPLDLRDRFALLAPGQALPADHLVALFRGNGPTGVGLVEVRGGDSGTAVAVLALATVALLFVGLLAAAGFTVTAQRRMRALGVLGAIGASHRHIRLVLIAGGGVVGVIGALTGTVVGLAAWFTFAPGLEPFVAHRVDRLDLPWPAVVAAVLLAVATAVTSAWLPARTASRVPIVAALAARPVRPRPTRRFAVVGAVSIVVGLVCLVAARQRAPALVVAGILAVGVGILLLAPVGIAAVGPLARRAPLTSRIALRDLARYRARSSAALAAIALAVGIASAIALTAGVAVAKAQAPTGGNLPADHLAIWLSDEGAVGPVPVLSPAQEAGARARVDAIAADLGATSVLPLRAAADPDGPAQQGGRDAVQFGLPHAKTVNGRSARTYTNTESVPVFVATPDILGAYRITAGPDTDILSVRTDLDRYDLIPGRYRDWQPRYQRAALPAFTSLPGTLITERAMRDLNLTSYPVGWVVRAADPVTPAQIERAEKSALAAGLSVEARPTGADLARLATCATGAGVLLTLGVLAMTVGLIRGETARDTRTLTATGASRRVRRAIVAATAGALALLGALIGTVGAYLAVFAWYHAEPHWLAHVPVADLLAIVVALPALAYAGGWLLAGREASGRPALT